MTVLVFADYADGRLSDDVAKAVTAAKKFSQEINVLVAGKNVAAIAEQAAQLAGVEKVVVADDAAYENQLSEPLADLVVSLAGNYEVVLAAASTVAKSVLPRVAAKLDVMQISEVVDVIASDTFARPIYAGNAIQVVKSSDSKKVLTIRATAFDATATAGSAVIETAITTVNTGLTTFVSQALATSERPGLASARVVVAGGRALGSAEKFTETLSPLADKLGAAIGASRAAVDSGYAPNDWQIGQTGKIVAPDLYFACGISGAIQHLAGMTGSKVIVAINKDEEAPIFQVADFGLVGDLFEVMPELTKSL
ncbi:electron transfer flavoprotein subunit alpha/FixB family protein [Pseudomonas taiwanensis]|uniref:electron transfer flavoprotein subunit alpha/FixB family protein n=1 Tax=Pseudomonas taiwanensis TaxID=470150 RepID=UPI0016492E50|nr:electron transfer flavoprotein subunit alpha/FixB family protein [Pseudomonas taiwanensis]MBC3492461.1 electron transfer flavoprotein subunit alpha/FixB family protein [Pseudomonas taiwanensis]